MERTTKTVSSISDQVKSAAESPVPELKALDGNFER